jgi:hypothetical protein
MLLAFLADNELPEDDVLELASECRFPAVNGHARADPRSHQQGAVADVIRPGYYLQSEIQALFR